MTKEDREKQIIEAAKETFTKKGYMGATTIEIAKNANISEVTLFRYFPSKIELFMATIEPIMIDSIENIFTIEGQTPREQLKTFLENRIEFIIKNSDLIKLLLIESETNKEISKKLKIVKKISDMLNHLFQQLDIFEEKRKIMERVVLGIFISFLFIPLEEQENISVYVDGIMNTIDEYIFYQQTK